MNEMMNFDDMKRQFDGEWVLIGDPVTDQQMRVLSGTLLCHSRDRAEVYRKGKELHPKHAAVLFLGKTPNDTEFLL